MKGSEMPRTARSCGSRRTGVSQQADTTWKGKGEKNDGHGQVSDICSRCYDLLKDSQDRRATKIRTVPRMPKNCTPALPAEVPRLYEGYIPDTQRHSPLDSAREK